MKSRRLNSARHITRMGTNRNAYKVSVGKSKGKRSLGRLTRRWEMELREIGWDGMD
jgi:hypothetical protein